MQYSYMPQPTTTTTAGILAMNTSTTATRPTTVLTVIQELLTRNKAHHDLLASILQQAKNNLATANTIARTNARLGRALRQIAMRDINTLRGNTASPLQLSTLAEYHNLGTFWDSASSAA